MRGQGLLLRDRTKCIGCCVGRGDRGKGRFLSREPVSRALRHWPLARLAPWNGGTAACGTVRRARPWRDVSGRMEVRIRKSGRKILVVHGHGPKVTFDTLDGRQLSAPVSAEGKVVGLRKAEILSSGCRYQRRGTAAQILWLPWMMRSGIKKSTSSKQCSYGLYTG